MEKTVILICSHNKEVTNYNKAYLPIHVGAALSSLRLNMQRDDEGDNISSKNKNYCELTGHYWAWKKLPKDVKYIGLVHYRRNFDWDGHQRDYFVKHVPDNQNLFEKANVDLNGCDIILPIRSVCPYSIKEQYCMGHISEDYNIMEDVIKQKYPEYYDAFHHIMRGNSYSPYNMFFTSREVFDEYSAWIFPLLSVIESRVHVSEYALQSRVFGFMSERLLNVFCYHKKLKVTYKPIFLADNNIDKNHGAFYAFCNNVRKDISYLLGKSK